jgi:glycosyltransferase involved in cell wall biosynthesis
MIKIVSCFWNASNYVEKCINSVKSQTFKDYKMFLIDDMSTDSSKDIVKKLIEGDDRFTFIENTNKKFKLKNFDDLIMDETLFDDEDIIVELDGDDWLYNENVLEIINKKYESNKNLWLTNGSFVYSNGRIGFSGKANYDSVRSDVFMFSHLRTWKTHLWRKIDESSFLDTNGEYFKSAADVAYSFPMVEMAGKNHYEFIPDILLVYNEESPYNDHKEGSSAGVNDQFRCASIIRNLPKYKSLN